MVQATPEPWLAAIGAVIIGREISISALREWMAEIGKRARVKVALTGKIKTIAQMVALAMLLYKDDLINIGCYIVDPTPEVLATLKEMKMHKEDPFFDIFISKKLVAGYDPLKDGFNVNVAEVYESLLHALA